MGLWNGGIEMEYVEDKGIVGDCRFGEISGEWNLGRGWLSIGLEKGG